MATFLLSVLIFGSAGYIIFSRIKSGKRVMTVKVLAQ